jgi:hypothetical protein
MSGSSSMTKMVSGCMLIPLMELTICLIYGIATKINIREVGRDVGVALQS